MKIKMDYQRFYFEIAGGNAGRIFDVLNIIKTLLTVTPLARERVPRTSRWDHMKSEGS